MWMLWPQQLHREMQYLRAGLAGGGCMSMKCCRAEQDEAAALARVRATGRRNRARRSASSGALAATDAERQVTSLRCDAATRVPCLTIRMHVYVAIPPFCRFHPNIRHSMDKLLC
jgi:hypothetical protein